MSFQLLMQSFYNQDYNLKTRCDLALKTLVLKNCPDKTVIGSNKIGLIELSANPKCRAFTHRQNIKSQEHISKGFTNNTVD